MTRTNRSSDQFMLRLPEGLRDRIKASSDEAGRSMNAEIIRVLEREFPSHIPIDDRVAELLGLMPEIARNGMTDAVLERMTEEMFDLMVLAASGAVEINSAAKEMITKSISQWRANEAGDPSARDAKKRKIKTRKPSART